MCPLVHIQAAVVLERNQRTELAQYIASKLGLLRQDSRQLVEMDLGLDLHHGTPENKRTPSRRRTHSRCVLRTWAYRRASPRTSLGSSRGTP